MAKILYSQSTQTTKSYPRTDDAPIVGLDSDYLVLTQVQTVPPVHDPGTQTVSSQYVVDTNALEYRQEWTVSQIEVYDPAQFLQQMFASSTFESWLSNFSVFKQSGFMNGATNAKVDNNWTVVQAMYDQLKAGFAPSQVSIDEWQSYADTNGISFIF